MTPEPLAADPQRRGHDRAIARSASVARGSAATSLTISRLARRDRPEPGRRRRLAPSGPSRRTRTKPSPPDGSRDASVDGDPGDGIDLERRADLLGQVVDEVELAISVERLPRERALVRLAGAGIGQDGGDRPGRSRALDPADRDALDHDREAVDRRVRRRGTGLAVEDDRRRRGR